MSPIVEIRSLSIRYKNGPAPASIAVDNIDLSLHKGEIFGFLGPNGAGKTSTIKTLLGIVLPTSGSVEIFGKPVSKTTRGLLGYMPEVADYYNYLTPKEILMFYGRIFGIDRATLAERIVKYLDMVGLSRHTNKLIRTFSKGMLQKVSFAQSLINEPELLILDEPTTGLDPIAKMNMRDILLRLRNDGKTIFFSSHELSEVELISDRVAIMRQGRILKTADPRNILDEKGQQVSLESYFFDLVRQE